MPASSTAAFEAFFNHRIRMKWDTLLSESVVEGGEEHPYVGAVSINRGRLGTFGLSMRTRFLTYDPPRHACASLAEPAGLFEKWAATIHVRDLAEGNCEFTYIYTLKLRPVWLGRFLDPLVELLFTRATRRRFDTMAKFLARHVS
jgi:hypothetical protein